MSMNVYYQKNFYDGSDDHVRDGCFADFADFDRNRFSDAITFIFFTSRFNTPLLSKTVFEIYSYT